MDTQPQSKHDEVRPNPFGTDLEVLAAVPPEHVAGLRNVKDEPSRMAMARAFAAEHRLTGNVTELEPFLLFLGSYELQSSAAATQEHREKSRTAGLMCYMLASGWMAADPPDVATSRRMENSAVRLSTDANSDVQIGALILLRIIGSPGSGFSLSPAALKAVESLASSEYISFQADRTIKSLLEQAKDRTEDR